jgi:hemerythrin superfamily protein
MAFLHLDSPGDATALLTEDHRRVEKMFSEFQELVERKESNEAKAELAQRICTELMVHAMIEEEIFYPAVRRAIEETDLLDEAEVEHMSAKALIALIMTSKPGADQFEAKVKVLGEYIKHHVREEEGEMFPKARKAIDNGAVGEKLAKRKTQLTEELAAGGDGSAPAAATRKRTRQSGRAASRRS